MATSETSTQIILILAIGTLGMLILASAVVAFFLLYSKRMVNKELKIQQILNLHQQDLINATIETQEKEQKRIAQDLHDEIGAMLSTVKMGVSLIQKEMNNLGGESQFISETKNNIDETIKNVRRISHDLLPPILTELGLSAALSAICDKINASSSISATFLSNQTLPRFAPAKELAIYRMVQEIINNSMKHSQCTKIKIETIINQHNKTQLIVSDNGVGFDIEKLKKGRGLGLKNIESRLSLLNGQYTVDTKSGTTYHFHFLIPLNKKNR